MKLALVLISLLLFNTTVLAGTWTRTDRTTVTFEGNIEPDEYSRFEKVFDREVETLIVNSGGGETMAAIKIAKKVYDQKIDVIVRETCLSSCANYIFPAGSRRIIDNGIVGFHGNMQACFGGSKLPGFEKELRDAGYTDRQVRATIRRFKKNFKIEKRFLKKLGVSQELFEISCTDDKGMKDGKAYYLLLPLPETFERFGIYGVEGEQSQDVIKRLKIPVAIW